MDLRDTAHALLRRWWLIVGLPVLVLVGTLLATADRPYLATVRAIVLIPGDTEVPGSAERPELMVLDDAPILIRSRYFAEAVAANLPPEADGLDADAVAAALSAERYSRVLTIEARHEGRREALAIAVGAAAALPAAVDHALVAPGGPRATVRIIDPPRRAIRDDANRTLVVTSLTLVALAAGIGLAALAVGLEGRLAATREQEPDRR